MTQVRGGGWGRKAAAQARLWLPSPDLVPGELRDRAGAWQAGSTRESLGALSGSTAMPPFAGGESAWQTGIDTALGRCKLREDA